MFGFEKKKPPVGAKDKIAVAKQMRDAGRFDLNVKGGEEKPYPSQTIPVTIIYVLATALAMLLTDDKNNPLAGVHLTGIPSFDNFVTGGGIIPFSGDPDEDRLITVLGRGMAFFALAGFAPLVAAAAERLFFKRRVMPLVLCWGVIVIMLLIYLCLPAIGGMPSLKSI